MAGRSCTLLMLPPAPGDAVSMSALLPASICRRVGCGHRAPSVQQQLGRSCLFARPRLAMLHRYRSDLAGVVIGLAASGGSALGGINLRASTVTAKLRTPAPGDGCPPPPCVSPSSLPAFSPSICKPPASPPRSGAHRGAARSATISGVRQAPACTIAGNSIFSDATMSCAAPTLLGLPRVGQQRAWRKTVGLRLLRAMPEGIRKAV